MAENLELRDSFLTSNRAGISGGGIAVSPLVGVQLTIERTTIQDNDALTGDGGGVFFDTSANASITSSLVVRSSTIENNEAAVDGGGILLEFPGQSSSSAEITNSTISGNTATSRGGGISALGNSVGSLQIHQSTIALNDANFGGGLRVNEVASAVVTGTIIGLNTANTRPDVSGTINANFDLIQNTTGANLIGANNITGVNPQIGPLAGNGGPTQTHALLPGSPAINASSSTESNDQRGTPFVRDDGNGVDIGSFEVQSIDFGDAPAAFPTTIAQNGASHQATGPQLGFNRDGELDGQPSPLADGDGSDDDGVFFGSIQQGATMAAVNIDLQNAVTGKIDAWIDFNGNGAWEASEKILSGEPVSGGLQTKNFAIPVTSIAGPVFARVRVSTDGVADPTGPAPDGEVEDYRINIVPIVPEVESVTINDGGASRSKITSVSVKFNTLIDLEFFPSFAFTNITTNTVVNTPLIGISTDAENKHTFTFFFGGPSTVPPIEEPLATTLADGNYRLDIPASDVRNAFVDTATMAADFVFGGQTASEPNNDDFFRWYGDDNGDGFTDFTDFANSFLPAFGSELGGVGMNYNEALDGNGDRFVDFNDFADEFLPHFGTGRP